MVVVQLLGNIDVSHKDLGESASAGILGSGIPLFCSVRFIILYHKGSMSSYMEGSHLVFLLKRAYGLFGVFFSFFPRGFM